MKLCVPAGDQRPAKSINSLTIVVARQSGLEMEEISKLING